MNVTLDFKKQYCSNLFTWKELETLINIRPLMSNSRVHILTDEDYTWNYNEWSSDPNCFPSDLLRKLIDEKVCSFYDMSTYTEKIHSFVQELEETYKLCTDAHIYTCRNLQLDHPFGIHFDDNDNVIVQCEGQTNFKVWDEVDPHYYWGRKDVPNCYNQRNLDMIDPPLLDVDMHPGDAIWIPKYYPHLATSNTKRLSVSFPLKFQSKLNVKRSWVRI